ncbi:MAG: hypothetical protein HYZ48_02180 [Chlamydiales bacterium]|nr:hypothetical protein [Chlamydiales bacterium]
MQTMESKQSYFQMPSSTQTEDFQEKIQTCAVDAVEEFKAITRQYAVFHIGFFILACLELLGFALFFSLLTRSAILAFSLAGIFLTGFAYFVLLFYFQAKKPEQLLAVRETFLQSCAGFLPFEKGSSHRHLYLKQALYDLFNRLHRQEYFYYRFPSHFKTLAPLMQKFSVWCHWKDLHQMKEFLLWMMIKEGIELVKMAPTDLDTHMSLANVYRFLASHYQDPRIAHPEAEHLWVSPEYHSLEMQEKFKKASQRAIEEYQILDHYAPNEPWVHAQLASIFRDLKLETQEMQAYEAILKLSPEDPQALFRLGVLYFRQGFHAQALSLYDKLKVQGSNRAEELLSHYDAYTQTV